MSLATAATVLCRRVSYGAVVITTTVSFQNLYGTFCDSHAAQAERRPGDDSESQLQA